jgi:hypothetical protein
MQVQQIIGIDGLMCTMKPSDANVEDRLPDAPAIVRRHPDAGG